MPSPWAGRAITTKPSSADLGWQILVTTYDSVHFASPFDPAEFFARFFIVFGVGGYLITVKSGVWGGLRN